jgi:hypothetical protein
MKPQTSLLLVSMGVAVLLLGCTQDPVGSAPGGLEPSPSSQQNEDRDDTGRGSQDGGSGGGY